MNQQTFRKQWLRSHKAYEKRAYRIFRKAFRTMGRSIPFDQLTEANYSGVLEHSIPTDTLKDAYTQVYLQIGIIHGTRIGRGINKDIKEFTTEAFLEAFRRYVYTWVLNNLGFRIQTVRAEYIKYINEIILKGLEEGKGILEVSKEIQKLVNSRNFYSWQSMRIARTESTGAANLGAVRSARSSNIVYEKVWVSATDNRVRRHPKSRFDHLEMNGKFVLENDYFDVDGELIEFPGAQFTKHGNQSSGQNVINCRCGVGFRAKRDRNGRVVRR